MATSVPFQKARALVFTLNNYKEDDIKALRAYATCAKYIIWGYEIAPTTGTPHLQGFVCWDNPRSVKKFTEILSKQPHIELLRGTHKQAAEYCKKDGKYEEFGELPQQGGRTDWNKALEMLKEGKQVMDVIDDQPHLAIAQRSLREIKYMILKPKHREVNVTVIWGGAGVGKTRYAYDNHPDIYSKPRGEWWDGYTGQKAILLDDYYGYLPYCELLRVLDRYPYQVPVKGGYVQAQWDTVIITSNKPPEKWYRDQGMSDALRRRLHKIFHMEIIDGALQTTPYDPPSDETQTPWWLTETTRDTPQSAHSRSQEVL